MTSIRRNVAVSLTTAPALAKTDQLKTGSSSYHYNHENMDP